MHVRPANLHDLPLLMAMETEYARDQRRAVVRKNPRLRTHMRRRGGETSKIVQRESSRWFRKHLKSRNSLVSIAEIGERPVGYSVVSIRANPPMRALRRQGSVDVLFVRGDYRGRRISSLLMQRAMEWFAKRGIKHIGLEVISDNIRARAIYKKWGFYDFFVSMNKEL
jgi:ribosomal protein S18 acetylase RimI-like enzyme